MSRRFGGQRRRKRGRAHSGHWGRDVGKDFRGGGRRVSGGKMRRHHGGGGAGRQRWLTRG